MACCSGTERHATLPHIAGKGHQSSSSGRTGALREPTQTAVIHHQLPFRSESYTLAYFDNHQTAEGAENPSGIIWLKKPDATCYTCCAATAIKHVIRQHQHGSAFSEAPHV